MEGAMGTVLVKERQQFTKSPINILNIKLIKKGTLNLNN